MILIYSLGRAIYHVVGAAGNPPHSGPPSRQDYFSQKVVSCHGGDQQTGLMLICQSQIDSSPFSDFSGRLCSAAELAWVIVKHRLKQMNKTV